MFTYLIQQESISYAEAMLINATGAERKEQLRKGVTHRRGIRGHFYIKRSRHNIDLVGLLPP